jgi:hypothetical protein
MQWRRVLLMKRILLILGLMPSLAWAGFNVTGGPDYSRDAGSSFTCSNLAGTSVTTQAGLSIATPALTLWNPVNSQKNLVLLDVGIDVTASPAAAAGFMLAYNVTPSSGPAATTLATVTTNLVGKSTGTLSGATGQCYRVATLPATPLALRYLGGTTGASGIGGVVLTDQTNGKVVVPPGGLISLQSTSAAAIIAHFTWREDSL